MPSLAAPDPTADPAGGRTLASAPGFGARLRTAMGTFGQGCVGLDPHPQILRDWGLRHDADGLARFAQICIEAFAGQVTAVKPQSAFFEEHGSRGIAVLEQILDAFRGSGTLTILDVKRGDIGSTMSGYARAYLAPGARLSADAITLSPFLGFESLRPALDLAAEHERGVFVLALTSNPEGAQVQLATGASGTVAASIVAGAAAENARAGGELGHVGLVIGATVGQALAQAGIDLASANAPILAPGFGAQGARLADGPELFGAAWPNVVPTSSREILAAGPDPAALRERAKVALPLN